MTKEKKTHSTQTSLRQILAVSRITFSELAREKILWSAGVFSILCTGLAYAVSQLSFADNARIALSFGLTAVSIVGGLISIIMGSVLIAKEVHNRTLYLVLTKAIWRWQFLLGRFGGLISILFINTLLMTTVFASVYFFLGGIFQITLLKCLFLQFIEFAVLSSIACIFSSFSTSTLSAILTSGVWVLGHAMSDLKVLAQKIEPVFLRPVLKFVSNILPDLTLFDIKMQATHQLSVSAGYVAMNTLYGVAFICFSLAAASLVFHKREL